MVSAIVFPALVCLVVLSVYLVASPVALDGSMADLIKDRLSDYALYTDKAPFIGTYGEGGPFNVVYVGLTLSLAWSIAAGLGSRPRMAGGV